jgi:hypothetical protein
MLIYNLDHCDVAHEKRLVNGSRGVVCGMASYEECMLQLDSEEVKARDAAKRAQRDGAALGNSPDADAMVASRSTALKHYAANLEAKGRASDSLVFPRIRFANGVCKIISPCCFSQQLFNGGYVFRIQLPIR